MQISEHYSDYPEKTLVVVTNNEMVKILSAHEREVEEIAVVNVSTAKPEERASGTPNSAPPDLDEMKTHARQELYKKLSKKLIKLIKDDYNHIILCSPEANKNEMVEQMHPDVMVAVDAVVPKNLASLPLDQIIRILQETKSE